ncbi:unnamed protein product [Bursaphelenchus okinawaensis]|uniref:Peptidase S9 prolyl oligopeptidase catalytic domain-containing protein n=1 Tax=Bursaphelenchus okinawaensis TaxID=465554 RepID=A0A811KPC9_9BILA|nr:unnamed protein product [Bursaphelenchus okinawaensis]CAG9106835.1 unnamed protein product [Bursaphelenchus okinawaensis]
MVGKEVRDFGSWDCSLDATFVTSGTYKGFPELQQTQDGTVFVLKQQTRDGSRLLFRKLPEEQEFKQIPCLSPIKNGVNAYGALAFFAKSNDEYAFTSPAKITWIRPDSEPFVIEKENVEFGDLFIHDNYLYALMEDKAHKPSEQSIIRIEYGKEGLFAMAKGYDFFGSPRVSPDGQYLTYLAWDNPNMPWDATTVHLVELQKNPTTAIRILPHLEQASTNYQSIQWAPDSQSFYFISDHNDFWMIYNYEVATNEIHRVAFEHEADLGDAIWQVGDDKFYSVNANFVIYTAKEALYKKNLKSGEITEIKIPGFNTFSKIFINSDNVIVCLAQGAVKGDTILTIDEKNQVALIDEVFNSSPLEQYGFGQYKLLDYLVKSDDGELFVVTGYFYPPVNPRFEGPEDEKPPVIIMAHGGPTAQTRPTFDKKKAFYQSKGFAIFDINYRGSTGRGRRYRDALYGQFGDADVNDVLSGINFLRDQGEFINPKAVFITGSSAGGYLLLRALMYNRKAFRGAACSYGFSDIKALCSEDHKFEHAYNFHLIGPKDDEAIWRERTMKGKLDMIRTPTIFFHGKEDPVVPFTQSIDVYEELWSNKVKTALELYEGEGHGFRIKENVEKTLNRTYNFFCDVLQVDPATHCYWAAAVAYPALEFAIQVNRDEKSFLGKLLVKRSKFKWSEENINLFDDELADYTAQEDVELGGTKVNFSTHPGLHDRIFSIFSAKDGVEIDIPTRILASNVEELRSILPESIKQLTSNTLTSDSLKLISDDELKTVLLSDEARKFIFRRCVEKASFWMYMFVHGFADIGVYMMFFPMFKTLKPIIGGYVSLVVTSLVAFGAYWFVVQPMVTKSYDLHIDRKIIERRPDLVKGAVEYLEKSQKYCLLMNRMAKKDRGHPFTLDGNPTDNSTPFTLRLEGIKHTVKAKETARRKTYV